MELMTEPLVEFPEGDPFDEMLSHVRIKAWRMADAALAEIREMAMRAKSAFDEPPMTDGQLLALEALRMMQNTSAWQLSMYQQLAMMPSQGPLQQQQGMSNAYKDALGVGLPGLVGIGLPRHWGI